SLPVLGFFAMNLRALGVPGTLSLFVTALLAFPAVSRAAPVSVDKGRFAVYVRDQLIGAETFSLEGTGDSLNLFSRAWRKLRTEQGEESLKKQLVLVAQKDYGLKSYQSNQTVGSDVLIRGIVIGDTAFTLYREFNGAGEGDRKILPPGRLFVLDSQLFSLVNLISLSLHDKTFETWPVTMVTLGAQDSIVSGTAADLGYETIRWSSRPVRARRP